MDRLFEGAAGIAGSSGAIMTPNATSRTASNLRVWTGTHPSGPGGEGDPHHTVARVTDFGHSMNAGSKTNAPSKKIGQCQCQSVGTFWAKFGLKCKKKKASVRSVGGKFLAFLGGPGSTPLGRSPLEGGRGSGPSSGLVRGSPRREEDRSGLLSRTRETVGRCHVTLPDVCATFSCCQV